MPLARLGFQPTSETGHLAAALHQQGGDQETGGFNSRRPGGHPGHRRGLPPRPRTRRAAAMRLRAWAGSGGAACDAAFHLDTAPAPVHWGWVGAFFVADSAGHRASPGRNLLLRILTQLPQSRTIVGRIRSCSSGSSRTASERPAPPLRRWWHRFRRRQITMPLRKLVHDTIADHASRRSTLPSKRRAEATWCYAGSNTSTMRQAESGVIATRHHSLAATSQPSLANRGHHKSRGHGISHAPSTAVTAASRCYRYSPGLCSALGCARCHDLRFERPA